MVNIQKNTYTYERQFYRVQNNLHMTVNALTNYRTKVMVFFYKYKTRYTILEKKKNRGSGPFVPITSTQIRPCLHIRNSQSEHNYYFPAEKKNAPNDSRKKNLYSAHPFEI